MVVENIYPIIIIFLANFGGAILRAVYPWLQKKKENEDTLRALDLIPKEKLTEEQLQFIKQMEQPLNFRKFYMFTTIVGLIGTVVLTVGSVSLLVTQLPGNLDMAAALILIPAIFLSGWGGGSFANQLMASKNASVTDTNKAMVSNILSKAETSKKESMD